MADKITPPKELSSSWWKKNIPKSLPKNSLIEAILKECDGMDDARLVKIVMDEAKKAVDKFGEEDALQIKGLPRYRVLAQELTKFKVIVTKEKHAELPAALDAMIALANGRRKVIAKAGNAASDMDSAGTAKTVKVVTSQTAEAADKAGNAQKILAALQKKAPTITDRKEIERAIGRARDIEGALTTLGKTMKSASKDKNGILKLPANKDLETRVRTVSKAVEGVKATCAATQKTLLAAAIRILGDKDGKILFMNAKAVPVKLDTGSND